MFPPLVGLPWWLSGEKSCCQWRRCRFDPWVVKIPGRRKWQPTPVFLSGKFHGQRSLVGYHPWGCKRVGHNLVTKQQEAPTSKGSNWEKKPAFLMEDYACKITHGYRGKRLLCPTSKGLFSAIARCLHPGIHTRRGVCAEGPFKSGYIMQT